MGNAIVHRGPDDVRYYDDGILSVVFRRLSIVDIQSGAQPIYNESGKQFIVANGEIYNHLELRSELDGRHHFSTRSDCEVPLHAYEEWGVEGLNKLRGMFAFAIWDIEKKQLFLARDRVGIKPLYICCLPDGLIFGSELKALLRHPKCPRELDWSQLERSSLAYSPNNSYVKGIDLLAGGETLRVSFDGTLYKQRYWNIENYLGTGTYDSKTYRTKYCELLEQVVDEHLQGEVDIGLHLSGGLDSSLLAVLLARKKKDLACFTVVERTTYCDGDVGAAKNLTDQLHLPWYPVFFDYRTVLEEMRFDLSRFEEFVWMMDSPRFDLEWVFKSEMDRVAKSLFPNLKIRFVGQGADEFAGGYSQRLDWMHPSWKSYIQQEVVPSLAMANATERGIQSQIGRMMNTRQSDKKSVGRYHQMMTLFSCQLQKHNLWHEDRSSSWHSTEARVPFLDHRLIELTASIPQALHQELFWKKQIVRDAMKHFSPGYNIDQPKIAFLETNDMRSVQIILHGIALRILNEFRHKYINSDDFLFDREQIEALAQRVINRSPGFFQDTERLLSCIAICIFERQCKQRDGFVRASHEPLTTLTPAGLESIGPYLRAQPIQKNNWQLSEIVRLPNATEIVTPLVKGTRDHFMLKADSTIFSQFSVQAKPWQARFLLNLDNAASAEFSLKDWIDEFDIEPLEFFEYLDVLFQCGFIERISTRSEIPTTMVLVRHFLVTWRSNLRYLI